MGLVSMARHGRNEPCSCGSGKKYKKCCGAVASTSGDTSKDAVEILSRSVSKIELAKALKSLRSVVDDSAFQEVSQIISPSGSHGALDKAIRGLAQEDEFILLTKALGTASHLTALEQRPIFKDGDFLTPDLLARSRRCTLQSRAFLSCRMLL